MKKTILIINRRHTREHSFDFASYITKLTQSRAVELDIEKPGFHSSSLPELENCPNRCSTCKCQAENAVGEKSGITQNEELFKNDLGHNGDYLSVLPELSDVINKVKQESRYADLLVIDPSLSFKTKSEAIPTHFVEEILATAECPVLISPECFEGIEDIVFCYDGTASSVFAIKQFTYLFPEYSSKNATILHIDKPGKTKSAEENEKIRTWLKPHYSSVNFHILSGEIKKELYRYFLNKEKLFVVMGAYGRNLLSSFFRQSTASNIIKSIDLPLFITHH